MNANTNSRKWSWIQLNEHRAAATGRLLLLLLLTLPIVVQAEFTFTTNNGAITITKYTGPGGAVVIPSTINGLPVTSIGDSAFISCTGLTSVTIGNSVTSIGIEAFGMCTNLTSVTIPNSVTYIGCDAFAGCTSLISITIPNSVTYIACEAFVSCTGLASVTIGNSVTHLEDYAFADCRNLTAVYFEGNAPTSISTVFRDSSNVIVYYIPVTTGWGTTFYGRPTAPWNGLVLYASPQTQTAEANSAVDLRVRVISASPLFCLWYLNDTNLISCGTNCVLELTNVEFSQSGAYSVVVTNATGAVTSSPALLNVVAPVERRPVRGVKVTGQTGSLLNVDYANSLSPAPNWTRLGSVSLTSPSQYCLDVTLPLPAQRFYRAWQATPLSQPPTLDLHMVPAITLTGAVGSSVRVDSINRFGPIDAWVTLDTVMLTNTSQLYFDTSAPGQPQRLYRLVQVL